MGTAAGRWAERWRKTADSDEVRDELLAPGRASPELRRRRRIGALGVTGAIASMLVGLRQMGVVRHLPEPPGRVWDTSKVTTSPAAFVLGTPDGPVGALGFTLVTILASRLAAAPPRRRPWASRLLAATALGSAVGAALYLRDMFTKEKRLCPYCLTTAAASFAIVPLAWPEIRSSLPFGVR